MLPSPRPVRACVTPMCCLHAYSPVLPLQMSVFLVAALNSLGMGATLIALSVIAIDGWSRGSWTNRAYAPLVHAGAALLVSSECNL